MKKSFKGFVAILLAVMMIVPAFAVATAEIAEEITIDRAEAGETVAARPGFTQYGTLVSKKSAAMDLSGIRNGKTFKAAETEAVASRQPSDIVSIMVELSAAPAADVVSNLRNADSYRQQLLDAQNVAVAKLDKALGIDIDVMYNYTVLFNGFAFEGEYRLVAEIDAMDGYHAFVAPEWESPDLFNTTTQVGAVEAWDLGYTGAGYAVAIIDTGCKVDHPAFSVQPEEVAFTQDDIAAVIAGGQLSAHGTQLTVGNVYYSAKIPFKWNYQGSNANVAHASSDHGTHVAGIAAGNGGEIRGVAPDAQICVMQVFNPTGGASWNNILPALEDCAVLGVAAANLSLGSPGGQETPWDNSFNQTLQRCVNAGVNLAMAAGNDYDVAFNNAWGGNYGTPSSWSYSGYALASNPDNGIVGSPSTWPAGMSVAAVQNSKASGLYFEVDGVNYGYSENEQNMVKFADALGGQDVEYVMVPNFGAPEDYEGIDVTGKVAVVSRGDITFIEKGYNAQDAGAAACIVYNNTTGTLNMVPFGTLDPSNNLIHDGNEGRIPHICVSQDTGAALAAAAEKVMYVANEAGIYDAIGGNQTTSFSSRGLTATMGMKPEITAPGGSIYSATDPAISGGLYAAWDGTSMATPHICGGMAIVSEYVDNNFPNASAAERKNLVDAIIMSTATQVYSNSGDFAPVHEQGAGELDLAKATTTKAYITVEGTEGNRPKLELGDDPEKTGAFEMTFTVHNFGTEDQVYQIVPSVLLNDLSAIGILDGQYVIVYSGDTWNIAGDPNAELVGDVNGDGFVGIADAIIVLRVAMGLITIDKNCDVDGDGSVTVADAVLVARIAMGLIDPITTGDVGDVTFNMPDSVTVPAGGTADVTIGAQLTDDIMEYIDTYYTSGALLEGFVQLVPENEDDVTLSVPFIRFYGDWNYAATIDRGYYYEDAQWNSNNYPNTIGYKKGSSIYGLGINPYVETEDLSYYLADRNAISPNGDGQMDTVNLAYTGLLRNSYVRYVVLDKDGNELDVLSNLDFMRKGYWADDHRTQLGVTEGMFPAGVNFAQYGDEVVIRIEAKLDNDGRHTTNPFSIEASECWKWDTPVTIDLEAPTIANFNADNGSYTFDVTDDNYVAYVGVYTVDGDALGEFVSEQGLFETERGVTTAIELVGNETAYIVVADYAMNERIYLWDGSTLTEVEGVQPPAPVTIPELNLYAYGKNLNTQTWIRFSTTNLESLYYGGGIQSDDGDYTAATFTGTYVYAVTANKELVRYDASDISGWTNKTTIGTLNVGYNVNEMAYNRATGKLYIVDGLAEVQEVNVDTAALTPVGDCEYGIAAMDFTPDGTCYIVDAYGEFCTFDIATCQPTALIGDGYGFVPYGSSGFFPQCGTYAEGVFFWFAADSSAQYYADMHLLAIDVNSGEFIDMGAVYGGLYCLGMFAYYFVPPASSINPTDFYDNFENGFNWETIDADGDGNEWAAEYFDQGLYQDGPKCAVSYSYTQADGVLHPDNWMISPEFTVGEDSYLSFFTASANPATGDIAEHYQVIIIPQGMTPDQGTVLDDIVMDTNALTEHLYDLSAFAGQTVSVCLRHYDCFDQYTLIVDSVGVGPLK